jgi:hypothetical protein
LSDHVSRCAADRFASTRQLRTHVGNEGYWKADWLDSVLLMVDFEVYSEPLRVMRMQAVSLGRMQGWVCLQVDRSKGVADLIE